VAKKEQPLGAKGAPGQYKLNQRMAIFNDRRTNRNRDRKSQRTNAIKESLNEERY
jgi:hypothetical protein